jgi:N utilization substance protein B
MPSKLPGEFKEDTSSGTGRRRARILCMRALYQFVVVGDPLDEQMQLLLEKSELREEVRDYAVHLIGLVHTSPTEIDQLLVECLSEKWSMERLASIDRCVMRMGTAELLYSLHVPTNVILNECIEIAKKYGSQEDSGRFVNGVLDQVAKRARGKL